MTILIRLTSNSFKSKEEICVFIQDFMTYSRYNFKRSNPRNSSKVLTFVCSCISKKINFKDEGDSVNSNEKKSEQLFTDEESKIKIAPTENRINKRKIKRSNLDSCNFRIKFTHDEEKKFYIFDTSSNLSHNHPPEKCRSIEVSNNKFTYLKILQPTFPKKYFYIKK